MHTSKHVQNLLRLRAQVRLAARRDIALTARQAYINITGSPNPASSVYKQLAIDAKALDLITIHYRSNRWYVEQK